MTCAVHDPSCKACPLHLSCKTVCIPAVHYPDVEPWPWDKPDQKRALYVIGEAPGYNEDLEGSPWVGKAGKLLKKAYIDHFKFTDHVDVYLSNAVRCRPYQNVNPSKTQLKACQGFYLADIINLQKVYDEVIVLCVGAPAVQSVLNTSLKKSFSRQGDTTDFRALTACSTKSTANMKWIIRVGDVVGPHLDDPTHPPFPRPCPTFTTYHPAALLRDKNKGPYVNAHLSMLRDYIKGELTYAIKGGNLKIAMAPMPPAYPLAWLSLDIETYGILQGQNQTQFHPLKSELYDGIRKENLCVTTGLSWPTPSGELAHAIFVMSRERDRRRLWSWIRKCSSSRRSGNKDLGPGSPGNGNTECISSTPTPSSPKEPSTASSETAPFEYLIGQNVKFDLMYLRHAYPECRPWLNHPLPIADLTITNYLYNEGRPERSLKALAPLLRITRYGHGFTQYATATCGSLHQYNCQDTAATILSHLKLESLISTLYGPTSPKIGTFNRQWYSRLLWLTVWMEESGIEMNEPALKGLMRSLVSRLHRLEKGIKDRWDINLRGKGSEAHKRAVMDEACRTLLTMNSLVPKLERTKVKQEISYCETNRNALLEALSVHTVAYQQLKSIGRVHTVAGTLDRYLYPLLVGRGKNHTDPTTKLVKGRAYSRIYPVASDFEDGKSGGTKQCRIVFKGPACQTFPPAIKACITARLWFDYSQIELRLAALLSNDPWMMSEYSKPDCDFHLGTAHKLFGEKDAKKFRQIGKTLNFLVIYLGGAHQYQATLMKNCGIARTVGQCQRDIDAWWAQAAGLAQWQAELYEFVCEHGYFQLPLAGQSRLFLGTRQDVKDQMKELVNMPVQAEAANIMLDAQFHLQWSFMQKGMKARLPLNVYDAATVECPKHEVPTVLREMARILPNPPYYQALCQTLGRTLPLQYEVTMKEKT